MTFKMPEPFARINSIMGKFASFNAPDYSVRKDDPIYSASQLTAAYRQGVEDAAAMIEMMGPHPLDPNESARRGAKQCADGIRSLLGGADGGKGK